MAKNCHTLRRMMLPARRRLEQRSAFQLYNDLESVVSRSIATCNVRLEKQMMSFSAGPDSRR